VCERWLDFGKFISDMGRRPDTSYTIERINNDGNYEPSNCKWMDRKFQNRNRRNAVVVIFEGHPAPLAEVAEKVGLTYSTLLGRYRKGERPPLLLSPLHPGLPRRSKG
jgi:hypothetical protein